MATHCQPCIAAGLPHTTLLPYDRHITASHDIRRQYALLFAQPRRRLLTCHYVGCQQRDGLSHIHTLLALHIHYRLRLHGYAICRRRRHTWSRQPVNEILIYATPE